MKRTSHARQIAMKSLFAMSLVSADLEETLAFLSAEESLIVEVTSIAREMARGTHERIDEIDRIIQAHLRRWDYSRVGNVEKAILRLAVYEMVYCPKTPVKVALNEALELGKEFTTRQSVRFINGVLDKVARQARQDGKDDKPVPSH